MRRVTVTAERIIAKKLKPGDLFSIYGPEYWDNALDRGSIGEAVYLRTHEPAESAGDADTMVYKITISVADDT